MKKVTIYTDGACSGNPGVGGWAAILIFNGVEKEISGYDKQTTNNRMELFAVIQALRALKESCEVGNIYGFRLCCGRFFKKLDNLLGEKQLENVRQKRRQKCRFVERFEI